MNKKGVKQQVGFARQTTQELSSQPESNRDGAKVGFKTNVNVSRLDQHDQNQPQGTAKKQGGVASLGRLDPLDIKYRSHKMPKELAVQVIDTETPKHRNRGQHSSDDSNHSKRSKSALSARRRSNNSSDAMSNHSYGSKSNRSRKPPSSKKPTKALTLAQKQLIEIEDKFKALKHLPKQQLHPFDFPPEELEVMKKLFPEHKPVPEGMPKNTENKNKGIPTFELINELKKRINVPDRAFQRMIGQLDRKNDKKITWNEFLNFLTNEGTRRETVNDAQLYGYGIKRLAKKGRHHLRVVDQFRGPEKLAEYYIDGMVLIKLKNIKLLLNLFENKEAKLYDLRSLQPLQTLIFASDYSIPKPKKQDKRKTTFGQADATNTVETYSKQNTNDVAFLGQSHASNLNLQNQGAASEADSNSMASLMHMQSGLIQTTLDGQNETLQTVTEERLQYNNAGADQDSNFIKRQGSQEQMNNAAKQANQSRQSHQMINRQVSQKTRKVASSIEKSKNNNQKVNFKQQRPNANNAKNNNNAISISKMNSFADTDIDPNEVSESYNNTGTAINVGKGIKLPLNKIINQRAKGTVMTSTSEYGSSSKAAGANGSRSLAGRPHSQQVQQEMLVRDGSDSDMQLRPVSQIEAWKLKGSIHNIKVGERREKEKEKAEKEQKGSTMGQKNNLILGLVDLSSKNSARDFAQRATEKSKLKNLSRKLTMIADGEEDLKQNMEKHRQKFKAKIEEVEKMNKRIDKRKEAQFFECYKQKEIADNIARETSMERIGGGGGGYEGNDSVSNSAYRSAMGSRLGGSLKRRRGTFGNNDDTSSRVSGTRSATAHDRYGNKTIAATASKVVNDGFINKDIDYFGKVDIVDRAIKATGYIPLALRDKQSLIKISQEHIDKLQLETTKCERALKRTADKKNDCMQRVLRIKEANRFFFTQNPLSPPYYYPEKEDHEENNTATTKDSSSPNDTEDQVANELSPRAQAKIDHKLLFADDIIPVPCEPGVIKKALEERRKKDKRTEEDQENNQAILLRKEKEHKINRKIKTTKEIYTVAADFCQSEDGETSLVALALIDQQILIYRVVQSGVKIRMKESFSFYVKFPGKSAVSALCLSHYVTDCRPILCVGSQKGDIGIYYIDHVNSQGKVCQKQIDMFNFFSRGISKLIIDSDPDDDEEVDDDDSLLDRTITGGALKQPFVHKFGVGEQTPSDTRKIERRMTAEPHDLISNSSNEGRSKAAETLKLTSQRQSTAFKEPSVWIRDDFWNVITNTRSNLRGEAVEGPNGITLWNKIYPKMIANEESAITLCNSLMKMKMDSLDAIDKIVGRWRFWMRENDDQPKEALINFDREMEFMQKKHAQDMAQKQNKASTKRSKSGSESNFKRTRSGQKPVQRRSSKLSGSQQTTKNGDNSTKNNNRNKVNRRDSLLLNAILEEDLENVSTYGDDAFPASNEYIQQKRSKTAAKGGDEQKQKSTVGGAKAVEKPISKLTYIKDIGLIVTAFNGTIKFFDAFNFYQVWKNDNKMRHENQHTNISTFDVSSSLGIMVTGGAEGLILSIDPHALGVTNQVDAHKGKEVLNVFLFDEQQQIISVGEDRSIYLWDAFRLDKLQTIKDHDESIHVPKFSSASFDSKEGMLYVGDQQLSIWKCDIDPIVEINALQIQTLSAAMTKERNLQPLVEASRKFSKQPKRQENVRTGSVLISGMSSLVDILCNDSAMYDNYFATVDTENLCRFWNLSEHSTNITFKIQMKKRITACDINKDCTLIAVGNQIGEAFVANKNSGGIIYRLPGADEEIGCIKFLSGQSEFWIVAALWHGKMVFWSQPNEQNNFTINAKVRIGHRGDINTLDCQANYIISGGQDGLLGVWNQFSGALKYAIKLPDPVDSSLETAETAKEKMRSATESAKTENAKLNATAKSGNMIRRTVAALMFHPYWRNVALVLQEGGNIHAVDVSNGMIVNDFLAYVQMNSSWAIDPSNYHMMVVGDQGKAILFNAKMGAHFKKQKESKFDLFSSTGEGPEKKAVHTKRVPVYQPRLDPLTNSPVESEKWTVIHNWFTAHSFSKTEPHFVNNVKHSKSACMFITSTNFGEVKLWDSLSCQPLGILNSPDFDPKFVTDFISRTKRSNQIVSQASEVISGEVAKTLNKFSKLIGKKII